MSSKDTFLSFLRKYKDKKLVITTHRHPDCDGTASMYAMGSLLKNSICAFQTPPGDDLRPLVEKLGMEYKLLKDLKKEDYDGLVVLDCHTYILLKDGKGWDIKLLIDHHQDESKTMDGEFEILETNSYSNVEIMYDILPKITKDIAFALAVGIIYDTARFKSADHTTFEKLSKLIKISGKKYREIFHYAYPQEPIHRREEVLNTLKDLEYSEYKGNLIVVSEGDTAASDTSTLLSDVGDFVFVLSEHPDETRVSARAGEYSAVPMNKVMNEVAKRLGGGGGGHAKAAGASTQKNIETTKETCVKVLKEFINKL